MRWGAIALVLVACGGDDDDLVADASHGVDACDCPPPDAPPVVESNRDRLVRTYFAYLQTIPTVTLTNGLRGADLADKCELWTALTPSARATFLTITHRLEGSRLEDGSSMLDHMTRMTKVNGGDGSTALDAGACGGDGNRLFLTLDATVHAALISVADGDGGITDIPTGAAWRDTQDLAGPHDPFDVSDETEDGAPRGQGHFFRDPTAAPATAALGRIDLETLVDPYAFEIDQDYDCVHASNPLCDYTFYGPPGGCAPAATTEGSALYTANYGDFEPAWTPAGC